jgi:hypothetical protein
MNKRKEKLVVSPDKRRRKKARKKREADDDLKDVGERGTEGGGLIGNAKRVSNWAAGPGVVKIWGFRHPP